MKQIGLLGLLTLTLLACQSTPENNSVVSSSKVISESPLETGMRLAQETQAALGKNLVQAIGDRGTAGAVSFCSEKAISITDSVALALNARIKRVSDKNRNLNNAPDESQLIYINQAKQMHQSGEAIKPKLIETDKGYIAYYPILTNAMCMQCHGNPETEITPETMAQLSTLYPEDKAQGYGPNDLRGIWVVEMDR